MAKPNGMVERGWCHLSFFYENSHEKKWDHALSTTTPEKHMILFQILPIIFELDAKKNRNTPTTFDSYQMTVQRYFSNIMMAHDRFERDESLETCK